MADEKTDIVSVSGELTESGVKASVVSRFASMLDRWGGSFFALSTASREGAADAIAAKSAARIKVIEAAGDVAAQQIRSNPALSDRAIEVLSADAWPVRTPTRQENLDHVLGRLVEDLRENANAPVAGPEAELHPEFVDRALRYAEDASTDELRVRWSKVFSQEIRKPGTFSRKDLRLFDEIDRQTAELFQKFASQRFGKFVPYGLIKDVGYSGMTTLREAGLVTTFDQGVLPGAKAIGTAQGTLLIVGDWKFGIPDGARIKLPGAGSFLHVVHGTKTVDGIHVLQFTQSGLAIASIVGEADRAVALKLARIISSHIGFESVRVGRVDGLQAAETVTATPEDASLTLAR